jgi:hypothetical protein
VVTRGLKRQPEKNNSTFVFLPNQTDDGSSIKHSGKKIVSRRLSAIEIERSISYDRRPICRQFP